MKFFILGDSWGVGEWKWNKGILVPVPNSGTDFYLSQNGHTVTNISAGSAGNFGQLRHARTCLEQNSDYDFIIWFHTEPIRDILEFIITDDDPEMQFANFDISDFFDAMHYIHKRNYIFAQKLFETFDIPIIPIGCLGKIDPCIAEFNFCKSMVSSWAAEILNFQHELPLNWDLTRLHRVIDYYDSVIDREQLLNEIVLMENFDREMKKRFPDRCHPGTQHHKLLADRLLLLCQI